MLLRTLIPFLEENQKDTKIHFARGGVRPEDALNEFLMGGFKSWQEHQTNENYGRRYIVALIRLGNMEWLYGGNKDLKNLSLSHIKKYFSYSILEIYKSTTDDAIILEREQWWKEVLISRGKFVYNKNYNKFTLSRETLLVRYW